MFDLVEFHMLHFKYILHQIYRQFKVPYDELHAAPVLMSVTEIAFLPVLLLMESSLFLRFQSLSERLTSRVSKYLPPRFASRGGRSLSRAQYSSGAAGDLSFYRFCRLTTHGTFMNLLDFCMISNHKKLKFSVKK